ncbi:MAG: transglycosylase SLT domain-containing protein [Prevotella sp.]
MKKINLLIITALFGCCTTITAQSEDDTEITVTNDKGEKEIIELPSGLTCEFDSLLSEYNIKTYLKEDTDCNMQDINPVYDKDVYIARLKRLPTRIEMPYNDAVQQIIDRYGIKLRQSVSTMLGLQNFYIPIFEEALEAYGLPLELKYLPVVESALNPNAVSRVGATGLWQFMITTGKRYGLEVNSLVDERRDPVKSSYAAAHYLSDLYKIFGDWNLVIAAYNCGPENINKAIHRSNGETDYWQIYPYLPKETRGYVPSFIAANYMMNYYCDHNICPMRAELPVKTDTIMVDRDVHFEQIASVLNIDIKQIKELNPQYRRNIVNGSNKLSALRLPADQINNFIDNQEKIYSYDTDNLLSKRSEVEINKNVPVTSTSKRSRSSRTSRKSTRTRSRSVTIRKGDTLSDIAKRNHTTVSKLKKLNRISGTNIRAGKKIRVK